MATETENQFENIQAEFNALLRQLSDKYIEARAFPHTENYSEKLDKMLQDVADYFDLSTEQPWYDSCSGEYEFYGGTNG